MRLTTNKDVSEMGMYELAHNACYIKEGLARYRDFEKDLDARVLARELLKKYADGDDAFVDDDDFDDEMIELLQYGTDTIEGLIALFYCNLWAMADLREKLKDYEDAEEQGLLLRLPIAIGSEFWELNYACKEPCIYPRIAHQLHHCVYVMEHLGKTAFLTREEAEQALKQMGE